MSLLVLLEAWRKRSQQYATFSAIIGMKDGNKQEEERKERVEKSLWLWVLMCAKAAPCPPAHNCRLLASHTI